MENKTDEIKVSEAAALLGRKGAASLQERYGTNHYRKTGLATKKKYGKDHYIKMSKLGVAKRKELSTQKLDLLAKAD